MGRREKEDGWMDRNVKEGEQGRNRNTEKRNRRESKRESEMGKYEMR